MKINHDSRSARWFNTALLLILILLVIQGGAAQASPAMVAASTPQVISYQGMVTVSGQPFNGSGQFKFAILDAAGATYWSNDGSLSGEPSAAVTLAVNKGLFNVLLGDTNLPGMTSGLGASTFNGGERYLRVWFSPDGKTYTQLTPDQRIASVPYALVAENAKTLNGQPAGAFAASDHTHPAELPSGAMVLGAPGDTNLTGAGFETWDMSNITCSKCGGWVATLPDSGLEMRIDQGAVWTGSELMIWGGNTNDVFHNDGARYNLKTNTWTPLPTSGLVERSQASAVWTGEDMIVWGGYNHALERYFDDGARYNLATNTWTPLPPSGLAGRANHTAVWASNPTTPVMLVWGRAGISNFYNDGASYNPATNAWTPLPDSGLTLRTNHSAVWTGTEMIIWGGFGDGMLTFNDGARYNLFTKAWTPISRVNPPAPRIGHTAIWTGSEMIIWGGGNYQSNSFKALSDGASYNPATDTWTPLPASPLAPRAYHNAVWTGTEMIVWGGYTTDRLNDGARYNPTTRTWTPLNNSGAPTARLASSAVWTGSNMIIWGGWDDHGYTNDGAVYDTHLAIYRKP